MFSTFGRGWQLVKASWAVLQSDKELILFPIVSSIVMIFVSIVFLLPTAILFGVFSLGLDDGAANSLGYVVLFAYYMVSYAIAIYFNVGLIGATMIRLDGGDPTLSDGFRIANERFGKILGYAAISATVGVVLRWLQEKGFIGHLVSGLVGLGWNLATFLAIPVLVSKDIGPMDAVKESAGLLKQTWGEQITGNFSMGGVFFLIYMAIILVGSAIIAGFFAISESGVTAAVIVFLLIIAVLTVAMIQSTLSGIFQAALYRFAETGVAPDQFDIDLIRGAFKPKRKR